MLPPCILVIIKNGCRNQAKGQWYLDPALVEGQQHSYVSGLIKPIAKPYLEDVDLNFITLD